MLFTLRSTIVTWRPSVFSTCPQCGLKQWDSTYLSISLEGKHRAQGQRREASPFATPCLAHMNILYSLEVSSLLLVWILPCSLEKPTPAFIGQLSGRKASSSTGIKERSSCYLTGTAPLPGRLLVPILTRDVMVRQKPFTGSVYWGQLVNLCTSVSSSDTFTVALWAEPRASSTQLRIGELVFVALSH